MPPNGATGSGRFKNSKAWSQFSPISFTYTYNDDDERLGRLNCHWGLPRRVLEGCSPACLDLSSISKIGFETRPLDLHKVLREWSSVPSALASYIYIYQRKSKPRSSNNFDKLEEY